MSDLSEEGSRRKQRFSEEFKRDAVRLIMAEGYTFKAAATAVGVSDQSLRAWYAKFAPPREPCGENATVADLRDKPSSRGGRQPVVTHHSDPGCQYTSDAYQQTLGIECSVSHTGNCYDNAIAERFFRSLKHEEYANLDPARLRVFKQIETSSNSLRLHQALGYIRPNDFKTEYAPALAA